MNVSRIGRTFVMSVVGLVLASCQAFGPSARSLSSATSVPVAAGEVPIPIEVIQVNGETAQALPVLSPPPAFAKVFEEVRPVGTVVDVGDAVEVTIWEAPPATLFGGSIGDTRIGTAIGTARPTTLPELLVGPEGTITVPFAGAVRARGRTLSEIESDIVARLRGRANAPQVQVRLVRNNTATVTMVGEFAQSARIPLTPRGERLLDALAQVGGVKSPVNLTTIQVTRSGKNYRMPLSLIIERNENNIMLATDDVVTALYQPYSFTVLGAAGRNDEIRFEAFGITLAQALGRIGGLQDGRANPRGVFLFRWRDRSDLTNLRDPAIYSFDLKDPAVYFLAQKFGIEDGDFIYVTNSPVAELQRFVGIVSQAILPAATVTTIAQQR
ncbi:polysaccharide export protein [Erythrobacter sp. sf7]|uniref:Polysaccharide export protein n=1 Tax=Erythrobacter fulvus TaxID=2987523 RepID=A0ABT5JME7_9SPHN|nr:polysaccharide biosynthesis/export family protein [Erythrobacter fulvus]MDC8753784.1 polysaccharide export protein [Erythrobacter fulvus]